MNLLSKLRVALFGGGSGQTERSADSLEGRVSRLELLIWLITEKLYLMELEQKTKSFLDGKIGSIDKDSGGGFTH